MIGELDAILLEHSAGILLLVDPASRTLCAANESSLRILGYRRDELLGRPITDVECSLADSFFWEEVMEGTCPATYRADGSYRCSGGEILQATKTVTRLSRAGKSWLLVRAMPLEVGPRVEDELAAAASLLRATLEASTEGILLVDRSGAIVNMNQRLARLWELPEERLVAHDDDAISHAMAARFDDPAAYRSRLAEIAPTADDDTFDLLHLADGRLIERYSRPAKHGTHILGRVFTFIDISERTRAERARASLEAQLHQSHKMQALGTLAGGVAHDFNNIIATILGNTDLARQDANQNANVLQSLEEIHKAGTRARDLVQQILSFSRRQPTERKPIALGPVLLEAARLLRATLPARLTLDLQCDPDPYFPLVLADATQIEQVLLNLATNAMQAIPAGPGRITIRLDSVLLDARQVEAMPALLDLHARHPGRAVRISVGDSGMGMDAATQGRIFEPFFTTKPVNEGTGLGLSVVHGIVEGHEGAITVDSAPGKGTTFTIYLPADVPAAVAAQPVPAPKDGPVASGTAAGMRLLYIDDDLAMGSMVQRLLSRRGYRVTTHVDGRTALDALAADAQQFDLVVTDYNMPAMSGLDVAREVRSLRPSLPVAVTSGFIDENLHAHAAVAGVRELILKGESVDAFCASVQRLAQSIGKTSTTEQS